MKKILKKFGNLRDILDKYFMAVAFAEGDCPEYAREILGKDKSPENLREKVEKIQVAITYAEANDHEYATEILKNKYKIKRD